jgi:DNA invertase Pin-like site-specific DNA recombinase
MWLRSFAGPRRGFVSATEAIDTSLPSGELVFQIFGAIAQFERAVSGERVKAGLGKHGVTGSESVVRQFGH